MTVAMQCVCNVCLNLESGGVARRGPGGCTGEGPSVDMQQRCKRCDQSVSCMTCPR